jgi:hypothetical protein
MERLRDMRASSPADAVAADQEVAATVRLLHRRQGWGRVAITSFLVAGLGFAAIINADQQGTPPPLWFNATVIAIGALAVVSVAMSVLDKVLLGRKPAEVLEQAVPLAARHPRGHRAHHYPPRHWVTWTLRWVAMLALVGLGVISVPGVVDGVAYLAGAEKVVTFDPVSYQTYCTHTNCQTSTDGILQTGGAGTSASWPAQVPLGTPFQVREPLWKWGLGGSLISSDRIAVVAIAVSLLIDAFAALVVFALIRLACNRYRHVRVPLTTLPVP